MVSQTNTNRGRGQRDRRGRKDEEKSPYIEKVVSIRRVSKVVKGEETYLLLHLLLLVMKRVKLDIRLVKQLQFQMQLEKQLQLLRKR